MEEPIKFYSTNRRSPEVVFREALLRGQAPDLGLYMPEYIPEIGTEEMEGFRKLPYYKVAEHIISGFLQGQISRQELGELVADAYDFEVPLEHVCNRSYILRLDQGPTASFKDFAARMMGRLMQYYLRQEQRKLLILTATSGDTGSAVASAFYGLSNIEVVILYPRREVTMRQRKQMTTLGKNIHVLGLDAKFDDCQTLVKRAFADPELDGLNLSSANSINIGRLIPQIVYYFYTWSRLSKGEEQVIFSVPSGNFGDMMGGVLAMKMGLPVRKFVIATNGNDEFPIYLNTGVYRKVEPSRNCISSAMNVGHPSNLARLVDLYGGQMDEKGQILREADMAQLRNRFWSVSIPDEITRETIASAFRQYGVLLEPHGAVGWAGLQSYFDHHPEENPKDQLCISLETAHPAKFPEEIIRILGIDPELPPSLAGIDHLPEQTEHLENSYPAFKEYLISSF